MTLAGDPLAADAAAPGPAAAAGDATATVLSAQQLFALADAARDRGDLQTAEAAYRALAGNRDVRLRTEARFRLGMLLADQRHDYRAAAVEFRRILDEQPRTPRVRLELARVLALMGDVGGAERAFRAAEAAGLPRDVQQMVRFYANALETRKTLGGNVELAIAPDSNVNRATRSDTLGTVLGDFTLGRDARERSGVGLTARAQGYLRHRLGATLNLVARVSGSADLYRATRFDDVVLATQIGPELTAGRDRIALAAGPAWRWYGGTPYSATLAATANWRHPLGKRTLLRVDGSAGHVVNRFNAAQNGATYSLGAGVDRAVSARLGGGVQLFVSRQAARDPGYGDVSAGAAGYAFREIGRTTAVVSLAYRRLEADARLALYPKRRADTQVSLTASATWRALQVKGFAPFTRVRLERNRSTVGLYDYTRKAVELGITSAF